MATKRIITVTDGSKINAKPINPIQKVINSDEYLINKMNQKLKGVKIVEANKQPRDNNGRFMSTQKRTPEQKPTPMKDKVEEILATSTFDELADSLKELHARKNKDYGNAWKKHLMKYGLRPFTMRVSEKVDRIDSIIDNGCAFVKDESIMDTLLDIAAYALMTAAELKDDKEGNILKKI